MIKKIVTAAFIVAFGLAMTNVTFANHAEDVMCTAHYQPVCGEVQVQCITAPCYPVQQTFGNRCEAERAHAMNIQDGTCDSQSQTLVNTDRKLTSFNDQAVNDAATVSFGSSTLSAKVCNSKSASYSVSGNVLQVGPMMSTLMFCTGPLGTYEAAFDLSGARYNILGSKLIIDTIEGNRFQWLKTVTYPPLPPVSRKERMYGRIIRQVHQIEKLRGYDTVEEKKAFVSSLLEKINDIMMRSSMTRAQNAAFVFLKKALLYYYDRIS